MERNIKKTDTWIDEGVLRLMRSFVMCITVSGQDTDQFFRETMDYQDKKRVTPQKDCGIIL